MKFTKYLLKDVANVDISGVDKKSKPGETQVRLCNFVDVYYNWAVTKSMTDNFMVATANNNQIEKFTIKKGQVAITKDSETRDDIGVSTYIADDFDELVILGYHNALITPDESKLDGKYLNAYLHTKMAQNYFSYNASGSGQRYALSVDAINDFQIYLPPIEEQCRVGNLLSDIDRKIALNKSINCDLEAMAKQLYDYWFVQFDFPNAEGKPYKSSGGKMVWNETLKREIPEGWEVENLFDATDVQYGFPFATESFVEEETSIPIVRIRDILEGSISAYSTEETDIIRYKLQKGDLLIGMDGNFHMNYWHEDSAYLNQRSVRIRPLKHSSISAMQSYFELRPYIKAKESNAKGSTVGHLSDKDLKGLWLMSPKTNNKFNPRLVFDSILNKIVLNRQQIKDLTKQRDILLPLLMNGQVSIKQPTNRNL